MDMGRELAASSWMQRTKGAWEMAVRTDCGGGPIQGQGPFSSHPGMVVG